jgi:Ankyrin repeats (3 copies)
MKDLLEGAANVDSLDSQRWTPLFWTSFKGNIPALRLLLDRSANHLSRDVHGWTALHWAMSRGEEHSVSILFVHHAHYMSEGEKLGPWARIPDDFSQDVNAVNSLHWKTPMEVAAEAQDATIFDILLKNQHATSEKSFNALWSSGHFDPPMSNTWRTMNKAEKINGLESYISRLWWGEPRKEKDDTAWKARMLHSAIKDQKLSVMQLLLEIGADANYKTP